MSKFKVGDRVRVYHGAHVFVAEVTDFVSSGVCVRTIGGGLWDVHPNQCRRLVKKERRRVWVVFNSAGLVKSTHLSYERAMLNQHLFDGDDIVEFIEVRRKK